MCPCAKISFYVESLFTYSGAHDFGNTGKEFNLVFQPLRKNVKFTIRVTVFRFDYIFPWQWYLVKGHEHDICISEVIYDDRLDVGFRHRDTLDSRTYLIPHLLHCSTRGRPVQFYVYCRPSHGSLGAYPSDTIKCVNLFLNRSRN